MTDLQPQSSTPEQRPESRSIGALVIEREFEASRVEVFHAWTDPQAIVSWWGPEDVTIPRSHFDVRVGGQWQTTMRSPGGEEFTVSGEYQELKEPERIVMTWAWHTDGQRGEETLVTVELKERGEKTLMRFEQREFTTEERRKLHSEGWESSFKCLTLKLTGKA